jgi:hypothetical protein
MSHHTILDIISSVHKEQPNLNPTEIYNEGWMTRLLIYHSQKEKLILHEIPFSSLSNWTSEGLISSPFVNADSIREGYTHADITLGDFSIDFNNRGQVYVNEDAELFGIIEAKMGSPLGAGTTNAPNYNQASRNIACIAYNTIGTNISSFFGVVAPEATIKKHQIESKLNKDFYYGQIEDRFKMYDKNNAIWEFSEGVLRRALAIRTFVFSFEEWIEALTGKDCHYELEDFYSQCLKWNNI